MNVENRQDHLDPLLAAAYEELRAEATPEVDWERLRSSISARAELDLSRRRLRRIARMSRPLAPLALAASLAFALWLAPSYVRDILQPTSVATAESANVEAILEQVLDDEVSDQELRNLVTGRANPEAMLVMAVSDR